MKSTLLLIFFLFFNAKSKSQECTNGICFNSDISRKVLKKSSYEYLYINMVIENRRDTVIPIARPRIGFSTTNVEKPDIVLNIYKKIRKNRYKAIDLSSVFIDYFPIEDTSIKLNKSNPYREKFFLYPVFPFIQKGVFKVSLCYYFNGSKIDANDIFFRIL